MNSEQMRELADVLWNLMARFTYESDRTPLRDASTFLRQCAEQLPIGEIVEAHGLTGVSIPEMPAVGTMLYAAPVPPQAEPDDDDDALVLGEPDILTPEDVRRLVPQAEPKRGLTCLWSRADDDTDTWETACRHAFTIIEGTPTDNSMAFCCYCGRTLEQEIGGSDAE